MCVEGNDLFCCFQQVVVYDGGCVEECVIQIVLWYGVCVCSHSDNEQH